MFAVLYIIFATPAAQAQSEPAVAAGGAKMFDPGSIREMAREISSRPYQAPPPVNVTRDWSYDAQRKLRFRVDRAPWREKPPHFEIHPLPAGWLFKHDVEVSLVENGKVRPYRATPADFPTFPSVENGTVPLSGFRINGPLNVTDIADEIIVFQGASYFRAVAKGQLYGLSARGLAIGTEAGLGEEFPSFTKFWIVKPEPGADTILVHALLDSKSTTGAFTFAIRPGDQTTVDVSAYLYPRVNIAQVGLAPLTSMHLLSPTNPVRVKDYRPRVHDSDGLAITNGKGERIWRPLNNPKEFQVSVFADENPRGFGLVQRHRVFADYDDLEARYERRPTAWIDTVQMTGAGRIVLVEIPSPEEINDNIVAFWQPESPLKAGEEYAMRYRVLWTDDAPLKDSGPWVVQTRVGRAYHVEGNGYRFVIDYRDSAPFAQGTLPEAKVTATGGRIENITVQPNEETKGVRVSFVLFPDAAKVSELRLTMTPWNGRLPETWLWRWLDGE
jgi:periplasmic glucans biosynthesis protein